MNLAYHGYVSENRLQFIDARKKRRGEETNPEMENGRVVRGPELIEKQPRWEGISRHVGVLKKKRRTGFGQPPFGQA